MYARAGRAEERSERHAWSVQKNKRKARATLTWTRGCLAYAGRAAPRNFTVTGQWSSPSDYRVSGVNILDTKS